MKITLVYIKSANDTHYVNGYDNQGEIQLAEFINYDDAWLYCVKNYNQVFIGRP